MCIRDRVDVFCKNPSVTDPGSSLEGDGNVRIWYPLTLPEGVSLSAEGVKKYDGETYGLGWKDKKAGTQEIQLGTADICAYYRTKDGSSTLELVKDGKFTMPAAAVTLLAHNVDAYGKCSNCGRTDLVTAYQNGHLTIEGLTGRTYDSYPQILSKITWTSSANKNEVLTAPQYRDGHGTPGFGLSLIHISEPTRP